MKRNHGRRLFVLAPVFLMLGSLVASDAARAGEAGLATLPESEAAARVAADLASVARYRRGLRAVLRYMKDDTATFPAKQLEKPRVLDAERRRIALDTWKRGLDYVLALDSIGKYHHAFHKAKGGDLRKQSFLARYAAFLAQYAFAMEFIEIAERDPAFDTVFNEAAPDLGLPEGAYGQFKFRFLNVARATEFGALTAVQRLWRVAPPEGLKQAMEADKATIWRMGKGTGPAMTGRNALDMARDAGMDAWFPVQAGVSEWMGDVKVRRKGVSLVSPEHIAAMAERLEPGDILLERREWFLSNVGLPGYWPHAALYIGTPETRRACFDTPDVRLWVRGQGRADGDFEALLRERFPEKYATAAQVQPDGHAPRVIEAMSEGVLFTTLEHSADADCVAALRPNLPPRDKAAAILRAFGYVGRPYDFDFDFVSDDALVCTEVVYKAYQPGGDTTGLKLPLSTVLGRRVTPANEIARMFDAECDGEHTQLTLVHFLDGVERSRSAVVSDTAAFRESWKRPKWHILVQEKP